MDSDEDKKAIMDFYDRRRVTRNQFEEFLKKPENPQDTRPFRRLLQDVDEDQRKPLFEIGRSVCCIEKRVCGNGPFIPIGTGFHVGGGWIMSNQHVICDSDEESSDASVLRFAFPDRIIDPAPRNVIFSYFQDPDDTTAVNDSKKDLALIFVEEITGGETRIPGLVNVFQKPAKEADRVFLIHYGDGVEDYGDGDEDKRRPQQFSVSDNKLCFNVENKKGNRFSVHTAHGRPGSSGAPLLVFDEQQHKFLVAAVHYAGPAWGKMIDSPGYALWYAKSEWIGNTVYIASMAVRICDWATSHRGKNIGDEVMKECSDDLEKYLKHHSLRLALKEKLPNGVDFNYENIIFCTE